MTTIDLLLNQLNCQINFIHRAHMPGHSSFIFLVSYDDYRALKDDLNMHVFDPGLPPLEYLIWRGYKIYPDPKVRDKQPKIAYWNGADHVFLEDSKEYQSLRRSGIFQCENDN